MPIYEYVCGACGNAHEALQKISDAPLTDCSACGQSALKKKVSAPQEIEVYLVLNLIGLLY